MICLTFVSYGQSIWLPIFIVPTRGHIGATMPTRGHIGATMPTRGRTHAAMPTRGHAGAAMPTRGHAGAAMPHRGALAHPCPRWRTLGMLPHAGARQDPARLVPGGVAAERRAQRR